VASYADQVRRALDQAGIDRAALCGISFGGVIALQFAAEHPRRVSALVLASTPGPRWKLDPEQAVYAKYPRISAPVFFARMPQRLRPELMRAVPDRGDRVRLGLDAIRTFFRAPVSPVRMAARARAIEAHDLSAGFGGMAVPTLVIVGDASLDRVVPAEGSAEYARLIPGASLVRMENTGHQGSITQPDAFAKLVANFLGRTRHAAA
jgi:pimeloyl-ACP methyl ester carboxylesterase